MIVLSKQAQEELIQSGYRYACALSGDPDSSRDLVHDAWVSITKRYGSRPNKALLFRVIRNRYIDHYRHSTRYTHIDFDDQDSLIHTAANGQLGLAELENKHLANSLAKLRLEERETLFLSVIEGYTAAEIAELGSRSRGTVLSLLHRTKLKLRKYLTESEINTTQHKKNHTPENDNVIPIRKVQEQ